MKLIVFTFVYPFGKGEEFLEEEMRVAEKCFDEIVIVSRAKDTSDKNKYIPTNARVVTVRKDMRTVGRILRAVKCVFFLRLWREFFFAVRTTDYAPATILKGILLNESAVSYVISHEKEWLAPDEKAVYYSYWFNAMFAFRNAKRMQGIRITRAHGGDCFYSRSYHPYRREALRNLDYVFPISEAGRRDIIEHYADEVPDLAEKVRTARLGITIPDALNPYSRQEERTIVSCSNIIQLKRLDLLIDALSEITDMRIRWIHFGDGALRGEMEQYAQQRLGEKENIRYELRGYMPNSELMSFYRSTAVDLFVNCSDVEGIPVAVMEAMAHGIPAIGRSVGGMNELIDASCGVLLPEQADAQELSSAIQMILRLSPEAYTALRTAARERIERDYDAQRNYHMLFDFIKGRLSCKDGI